MKRIFAIALAVVSLCAPRAPAQSSSIGAFLARLRFSVESLPEQDGGGFKGNAGYKFSERLSSRIYVKQLVTAETGELDLGEYAPGQDVADSSLDLLKNSVTELFILPAEWNLGWNGLTLGLGAYLSLVDSRNVGYFKLSQGYIDELAALATPIVAPKTNYYDSGSVASFIGPVLTAQAEFDFGFVSLSPRLVAVPFFFFTEEQSLEVDPLLTVRGWDKGSNSYSSSGFPYIALAAEDLYFPVGKMLGLNFLKLGGSLAYEISKQDAEILEAGFDASEKVWAGREVEVTSTTFTYLAKIGIDLGNSSFVSFGIGQRKSSSEEKGGGKATATKPTFSLKYELRK